MRDKTKASHHKITIPQKNKRAGILFEINPTFMQTNKQFFQENGKNEKTIKERHSLGVDAGNKQRFREIKERIH